MTLTNIIRGDVKKLSSLAILTFLVATGSVNAAEKFRVASGGFTIAIHSLPACRTLRTAS
jgi:hypothetical protein